MSEQQSLIPNLNEIMEKNAGGEKKATPELQTVASQEKRAKTRPETEQQQKESRKRKRDAKESEIEQSCDAPKPGVL